MRSLHTSLLLLVVAVAASARPPRDLGGTFPEITVGEAQRGVGAGTRVRWGGSIVTVDVDHRDTCFDMVSRPLDRWARPQETDATQGRFLLNAGIATLLEEASQAERIAAQRLVAEHEMGELFKVIGLHRGPFWDALGFRQGDRTHTL